MGARSTSPPLPVPPKPPVGAAGLFNAPGPRPHYSTLVPLVTRPALPCFRSLRALRPDVSRFNKGERDRRRTAGARRPSARDRHRRRAPRRARRRARGPAGARGPRAPVDHAPGRLRARRRVRRGFPLAPPLLFTMANSTVRFARCYNSDLLDGPPPFSGSLYDRGSLSFKPPATGIPLVIDHDTGQAIGCVRSISELEELDGRWYVAHATLTSKPGWFQPGTGARFESIQRPARNSAVPRVAHCLRRCSSWLPRTWPAQPLPIAGSPRRRSQAPAGRDAYRGVGVRDDPVRPSPRPRPGAAAEALEGGTAARVESCTKSSLLLSCGVSRMLYTRDVLTLLLLAPGGRRPSPLGAASRITGYHAATTVLHFASGAS